jgi:ABC-2 type transport system permease protein
MAGPSRVVNTRRHKISTIATFEFLAAVKRPGYLITTFGMPLFMAAYGGIVAIPAYFATQSEREPAVFGVVDSGALLALDQEVSSGSSPVPDEVKRALEATGQGSALDQAFMRASYVFRPYRAEPEARSALAERKIKGYFVVPPDYIARGVIDVYTADSLNVAGSDSRNAFANVVRERLLRGRFDEQTRARIVAPLRETRRFSVTRAGGLTDGGRTAGFVRVAVPLVFTVLFLMSVLMTSGYLMQGTAVEKENKVVEVLLSSADPDEILTGKLLGLGAAGLLQIVVWLMLLLVGGIGVLPLVLTSRIEMPWMALGLAVPLFLIAFLFFGSLMIGTGSLGSNMREAQQYAMVWSLTAALPMMMMAVLIREPHGVVARVMTWLPFSAGPVIMFRASTDIESLTWWEIGGAFAVLLLSTRLALRFGARLFRLGLLSASRPKLREILQQARLTT